MQKILVTGANGLVGSTLVKLLAEKGQQVYALTTKTNTKDLPQIKYIQVDFDEDWSTKKIPRDLDAIIHLAQSEFFRDFPKKASHVFNVNTWSTMKLIDFAANNNINKFIFASSGGIYGTGDRAFKETDSVEVGRNLGFYLNSKLSSELILESFKNLMSVNILRLFFVYGPGQKKEMLISRLVNSVLNNLPIQINGENGISINPIFASDVAEAIFKCLEVKESQIFNIAGKEILSLREIVETVGRLVGKEPVIVSTNSTAHNLLGDIELMSQELIKPNWSFKEGLKHLLREDFGIHA